MKDSRKFRDATREEIDWSNPSPQWQEMHDLRDAWEESCKSGSSLMFLRSALNNLRGRTLPDWLAHALMGILEDIWAKPATRKITA